MNLNVSECIGELLVCIEFYSMSYLSLYKRYTTTF